MTEDAKLGFEAVAKRWLESIKHTLASGTIVQCEIRIKNLAPFFKGIPLRNINPFQCERWAVERGEKLATQTFVHELETVRNVFSYPTDIYAGRVLALAIVKQFQKSDAFNKEFAEAKSELAAAKN